MSFITMKVRTSLRAALLLGGSGLLVSCANGVAPELPGTGMKTDDGNASGDGDHPLSQGDGDQTSGDGDQNQCSADANQCGGDGDGDGDTSSGDDGNSGDGDSSTGDGDSSSGDGDSSSGDGDSSSDDGSDGSGDGDGDGDSSSDDGSDGSGDGDTSSGDGDGDGDTSGGDGDGDISGGDGDGDTSSGDGDSSGDGLVWRQANETEFTSYPDPNSEECIEFSGCEYEGYFAALDDQQSEDWVASHNIIAVHSRDFNRYKLHTLRLRSGNHHIDAVVYDECADSDCDGCCTENASETGFLIDVESYTAEKFGVYDEVIEWACLDC